MKSPRDVSSVTEQRLMRSVVAAVEPVVTAATRRGSQKFDGRRVMTPYMLFAGLGILIYAGVANGSEAALVGGESARALAAGRTLFQERGCVGCH